MKCTKIVRRQHQQRTAEPRDRGIDPAAAKGRAMNSLVQGREQKYQHEAVGDQRRRQPVGAEAELDEIARRGERRTMPDELPDPRRIETLGERSELAHRFGIFAHSFADRSRHGRIPMVCNEWPDMLSASGSQINRRGARHPEKKKAGAVPAFFPRRGVTPRVERLVLTSCCAFCPF